MVYKGQPPAAQTRLENGSGGVNGKWLAQLNLQPSSFYTYSTIVLLKFEMYSQRNSIESHSREITDSLSCSQMTLWKSDALLPELVTVVFHLKYDMFQAANLPCQMVRLKFFWWQRTAASRLPVSSTPFTLQTQSLIAHPLRDDLSLASTLKRNFLLPDCKIPKDASEVFIFSFKKCGTVNLSTKKIHRN